MISIPGIEELTESDRITVFKKAEQRLLSGGLDADILRSRLQSITPPLDEEEENEETRVLELQARYDLESDGCPPCYPLSLDVPIKDPPKEYRRIIEYWESFTSTDDVVLCAQRSDWRKFRVSQQRMRHHYGSRSFSKFVEKVCERRRAHGLDGNVHLLYKVEHQSRQQDWIKFQDYHLRLHKQQQTERDGLLEDLQNIRNKAKSDHTAEEERAISGRLAFVDATIRWHEVMLEWIEDCRLALYPLTQASVEEDACHPKSSPNPPLLSKQRNVRAVLGDVRVSKSTPMAQTIRNRSPKATTSRSASIKSAVTLPSVTPHIPQRREIRPRRAKEKALDQILHLRSGSGRRVRPEKS